LAHAVDQQDIMRNHHPQVGILGVHSVASAP